MKLSFVIPCYRSEHTLEAVCAELTEKMKERPEYYYEIILVNDCSPDHVFSVMEQLTAVDSHIKAVELAKNMGKHSALMAGFAISTGDYVICLDDDGQCPVDQLWALLAPLHQGADVSMAQYGKKKQSWFKNFGSGMNAWMMTAMLGKPRELQFANFAAMKRFVIDEILRYNHPYTYLNGLILRTTKNIVNVPMEERARTQGTSGYTFSKSLKLWINGYTAFSIAPLRLSLWIGCFCLGIALVFWIAAIIGGVLRAAGWVWSAILIGAMCFMGGIVLMAVGLLGEYVGRIYMCINEAPQYVIRRTLPISESEHNRDEGKKRT